MKHLMDELVEALEVGQSGDVNNDDGRSDCHLISCASYMSNSEPSAVYL